MYNYFYKFVMLCVVVFGSSFYAHALTHFTSEFEYGNGGSGGATVLEQIQIQTDTLDDDWRSLFLTGAVFEPYTFANDGAGGIQANTGNTYLDMAYSGATIRVERIIDDGSSFLGTNCSSSSNPKIDFGDDMQDSAPKPFSLKDAGFWNEPSGCSNSSRNAILFTLPDSIDGFGVWLGDVESRSDGSGTPAFVEYFDESGNSLGSFDIGVASGVDQSLCGGPNASGSISACGNETTRFVGFRNDTNQEIRYMKIVVGDDDDELDGATVDGNNEHLSFVGPIVSMEPTTADLGITKVGSSPTAMSGDVYTYTLEVTNYGPRIAQDVTIYESFPDGFSLEESSISLMTGSTSSWYIGNMVSGGIQELTLTGTMVGMTGDVLNTARTTATNELGPQTNTGTFLTTIVCHPDTGTVCEGIANSCGETIQGVIGCDGICDAGPMEDNSTLGDSCNTGIGACEATGTIVCNPENLGVICSAVAGIPASNDMMCNGVDDDCDGIVDEDYISIETSCGVGECGAQGMTSCAGGEIVDSCEAGAPTTDDAVCDGLDNDCDGAIDEDYISIETSCGIGECGAQGMTSCAGGEIVDSCEAGAPATDDAVCDGLDNDCDGGVDEEYIPLDTVCGVGECGSIGTTSCEDGDILDTCIELAPASEVCDQLDNNCDGVVDEGDVCEEPVVIIPPVIPPISTTQTGGNNYCGDGIVRNGEQCDDGNFVDDDICKNDCTFPRKPIQKNQEIEQLTPVEESIVQNILSIKKENIEKDIYIQENHFSALALEEPLQLPMSLPNTGAGL